MRGPTLGQFELDVAETARGAIIRRQGQHDWRVVGRLVPGPPEGEPPVLVVERIGPDEPIRSEQLADALGLGRVPDDELLALLTGEFDTQMFSAGNRSVQYSNLWRSGSLRVSFNAAGGIAELEAGSDLTDEIFERLRKSTLSLLAADAGSEIVRCELVSDRYEVQGWWRRGNEWQILPAHPQTPSEPRAGGHPFVLEYRVPRSTDVRAAVARRERRLWELHLILALLLRGQLFREHAVSSYDWEAPQATLRGTWTFHLAEDDPPPETIGDVIEEFSDLGDAPQLETVPDEEYYSGTYRGDGHEMRLPESVSVVFDRVEEADAASRQAFLTACYWIDTANRVWYASKSLSFVAAINAIETLASEGQAPPHLCPTCAKNHYPGVTATFKRFVTTYATLDPAIANAVYKLRSNFVHNGAMHGLDVPSPWADIAPVRGDHYDLHGAALRAAKTAVRRWLLERT
jgi:hypothetical protein